MTLCAKPIRKYKDKRDMIYSKNQPEQSRRNQSLFKRRKMYRRTWEEEVLNIKFFLVLLFSRGY